MPFGVQRRRGPPEFPSTRRLGPPGLPNPVSRRRLTIEPTADWGMSVHIRRSTLSLRAKAPNLDEAAASVRFASEAEKNYPVSKFLNAAITLDAKWV